MRYSQVKSDCSELREIHVLSPHRDDAMLTFGGWLLAKRAAGIRIVVHILYGIDGNIDDAFWPASASTDATLRVHLEALGAILGSSVHAQIGFIFEQMGTKGRNPRNFRGCATCIRSLEERAVAMLAEFELIEYKYRTAYPLRGYSRFDSPVRERDAQIEMNRLRERGPRQPPKRFAGRIEEDLAPYTTPLHVILNRAYELMPSRVLVLSPLGIGGHPDHIIVSRMLETISREATNIDVRYGQDLPYAIQPESFQRAEPKFSSLAKIPLDVGATLKEKASLLDLYASQLTLDDRASVLEHARHAAKVMALFNGKSCDRFDAVEIQYAPSKPI